MPTSDQWSRWIIDTRFSGDAEAAKAGMRSLYSVRDKVLDQAQLHDGATLLDVGTGDGLIAFGALDRVGTSGRVILSDISQPLLEHCQALAKQLGVHDRCTFVRASADDLAPIADGSVDVVTTRSVLIYVADKARALHEFYRVLKLGGRISLFEPINRITTTQPETRFGWQGYDVTPVLHLARRIREFNQRRAASQTSMTDFDERDLLVFCEAAGFAEIHLELHVDIQPPEPQKWETMVHSPPNPLALSLAEVMAQVFSPDEAAQFEAHLRPLVERGQGRHVSARAYIWATKGKEEQR
jgi:ubiquinone/menaquinone biosynthesis C-methylase UbiE